MSMQALAYNMQGRAQSISAYILVLKTIIILVIISIRLLQSDKTMQVRWKGYGDAKRHEARFLCGHSAKD